nr:MAG TPA: hypothetical protein [Caudoviricetes sp.]
MLKVFYFIFRKLSKKSPYIVENFQRDFLLALCKSRQKEA